MSLKDFWKRGERLRMWLTELQIAIIEKNPQRIDALIGNMPKFESLEDMQSASSLIKEALNLMHHLKDETGQTLEKIQKHKDFLNSATADKTAKFDITS